MRWSVDAVLLDLDGTLVDSTPAVARCWRRWCAEFGLRYEDLAAHEAHGRPSREVVAELLPAELVDEAAARLDVLEIEDTDGVRPLPGAQALLDQLPAGRWAVITSCGRHLAAARTAAAGLRTSVVVTADDVARGKPDPEPYVLGARRLGVDPARCLVVEDAPSGVRAGRAAGAVVVALRTTHADTALTEADAVVDDLLDLRILRGSGTGSAASDGLVVALGRAVGDGH